MLLLFVKLSTAYSYSLEPQSYENGDKEAGRGADQSSCRVHGITTVLDSIDQSLYPFMDSLYQVMAFHLISSKALRLIIGQVRFSYGATLGRESWLVDQLSRS